MTTLEYRVHFQRGTRVGARSFRMIHVDAASKAQALMLATAKFPEARGEGYRVARVDYFDESGHMIRDV